MENENTLTAEEALVMLLDGFPQEPMVTARIFECLQVALMEIIELKKALAEHEHEVTWGWRGVRPSDFEIGDATVSDTVRPEQGGSDGR